MGQCTSSRSEIAFKCQQALNLWDTALIADNEDLLDDFVREEVCSVDQLDEMFLLHTACLHGSVKCARALLDLGVKVNTADYHTGMSPLHFACMSVNDKGAQICISLLLKAGASIDSRGGKKCRKTPLHLAIEKGRSGAVFELIERGCDVNMVSKCEKGISPLLLAIKSCQPDVMEVILQTGADISKCRSWNNKLSPPLDVLTYFMSCDSTKQHDWVAMFDLLIQADGNHLATLHQMPAGQNTKVKAIRTFYALKIILKRLGHSYGKQAENYLTSLISSGYTPRGEAREFLKQYNEAVYDWMNKYTQSPPPLRDLCVRVVRRSLPNNVVHGVQQLNISQSINDLICVKQPHEPLLISL